MQYNKSWKGQPHSCQCMLQEKEVWMWDKSDHMITANDEIFLKRKQPNRTNPLPERGGGRGWKMPTSKPKTFFFFFPGRRPDGILGHHAILQLEAEWFIYTPAPKCRYWRWERLLFAVWSRCGWTKWREHVQLEKPINQLPRAVGLDKYHLLLNSQRKISPIPGTCWFSACYAEAFVSFNIPNPMCGSEQWSYWLCLIWFWTMTAASGALG